MLFDHRVWEWDGEREVSRNLIIAVDSDLKITNILSRYGVQLPFAKSVRFQEFLDRNAAEIDLVALGELEPIDFAPHSLVP